MKVRCLSSFPLKQPAGVASESKSPPHPVIICQNKGLKSLCCLSAPLKVTFGQT